MENIGWLCRKCAEIERREARIVHGTTALPEIVRIDIDDE